MKTFIVINLKNGQKKYLSSKLDNWSRPRLVNFKSAVSFTEEWMARVFSDWFWENYWNYELYDSRDYETIFEKSPANTKPAKRQKSSKKS